MPSPRLILKTPSFRSNCEARASESMRLRTTSSISVQLIPGDPTMYSARQMVPQSASTSN